VEKIPQAIEANKNRNPLVEKIPPMENDLEEKPKKTREIGINILGFSPVFLGKML
jgi:hypothetical protein